MSPAYMSITQTGRWSYSIAWHPRGGWIALEGSTVLGWRRAKRRAERDLRRFSRQPEPVAIVHA